MTNLRLAEFFFSTLFFALSGCLFGSAVQLFLLALNIARTTP